MERLQEQMSAFPGTYLWLVIIGLVLGLLVLAFAYLLVRSQWNWFSHLIQHDAFRKADRGLSRHVPRLWTFIRNRFTVQQWRGLALTVAAVVIFIAGYLFALITEGWADEDALYTVDHYVYEGLTAAMNEQVATFMRAITHVADGLTITVLSVILGSVLLYLKYRWHVVGLVLSVGGGGIVMQGLKAIFARSRPEDQVTEVAGHSFPSGHAFLAMTFYGFLIYLAWRFIDRDIVRIGLTIVLVVLIVLVGLSRVVLRVHWVSDVAGGFTMGLAWLVCSLVITRAWRAYREPSDRVWRLSSPASIAMRDQRS